MLYAIYTYYVLEGNLQQHMAALANQSLLANGPTGIKSSPSEPIGNMDGRA
jgi:hypothetical protein